MAAMGAPADPAETAVQDDWLTELYRSEYRSLVRLAFLLLGDQGLSEEVVQDAFVRVHLARRKVREGDKILPYLRSAVLNGARSQLRRKAVRERAHLRVVRNDPTPETAALADDDTRRIVAALRSLPDRQRECLALRYYLDLSEAQIASTLGIGAGSVKTHVHRAMATLATRLEEDR